MGRMLIIVLIRVKKIKKMRNKAIKIKVKEKLEALIIISKVKIK